jgi:hypothetical protein
MSSSKDKGPEGQQGLKVFLSPSLIHDYAVSSIVNNNEQEHQEHKVTNNSDLFDWCLEGVEGFEGDAPHNINAFYVLLNEWYCKKNSTSVLLSREGFVKRVAFSKYFNDGGDSRSSCFLAGNMVAYKWANKLGCAFLFAFLFLAFQFQGSWEITYKFLQKKGIPFHVPFFQR